jgi:hypothetical protein
MSFEYFPWTKEMHDATHSVCVGQKSAQAGFTQTMLNKTFFTNDINKGSVLYVLPNAGIASDFSDDKFDKALESSPYLKNLYSDTKNKGHKRSGAASLWIRGARSRDGLISIDPQLIVYDEYDRMDKAMVSLAEERITGQIDWQQWKISTPTIPEVGINEAYLESTMEHFFFTCPACSRLTELVYPDCLVITADDHKDPGISDSHLICKECHTLLPHTAKREWLSTGSWVPQSSQTTIRGFQINQLYSATVTPADFATKALKAKLDPIEETEFHNSKLGDPHVVKGARITDQMINSCKSNYVNMEGKNLDILTMGIDVGTHLHIVVVTWKLPSTTYDINLDSLAKILVIQKVTDFSELYQKMKNYRVACCVIDMDPERRMATQFVRAFPKMAFMCHYGNNSSQKEINLNEDEQRITVDRTSWLDQTLSRFKAPTTVQLPADAPLEFNEHIKCPVRIYERDKDGNPTARYVMGQGQDHYAHAFNYAEMALPIAHKLYYQTPLGDPYFAHRN